MFTHVRACLRVYRRVHEARAPARSAFARGDRGPGEHVEWGFWTPCCMNQMVRYTPVWQSNCSLYAPYKHTCTYAHAGTHTRAQTHTRARSEMFSLLLSLSVRTERSCSGGLDSHDTHICQTDNILPDKRHTFSLLFYSPLPHSSHFCQRITHKKTKKKDIKIITCDIFPSSVLSGDCLRGPR